MRVNLYVPTLERLRLDHPLVKILGWPDAAKLSQAFGGEIMYPANCAEIVREFRNDSIVMMARQGMKPDAIGEVFKITGRNVRYVLTREIPPEEYREAANDNAPIDNQGASSGWNNHKTPLKPQLQP
jgi:hypothetical protein